MEISVTDAKARLPELLRRAEAGEDVVFTRRGRPVARLMPARADAPRQGLADRLLAIGALASQEALPGPCAARSQDWLYDDEGLPK